MEVAARTSWKRDFISNEKKTEKKNTKRPKSKRKQKVMETRKRTWSSHVKWK